MRDVIQRLERNAVGQRRVAENGHHLLVGAAFVARGGNTQGRRQGRARMRRAVTIVGTLGSQREPVQPVRQPHGMETVFASGEQFVNVRLMTDVPNELVFGRVKHSMERECQLDHAEVWPQMPAVPGEHRDQLVPDFFGELRELVHRQFLDVGRMINHVQKSVHSFSNGVMGFWSNGVRENSPHPDPLPREREQQRSRSQLPTAPASPTA